MNLWTSFLAVILEAVPFMLIGSLAGGLIEAFMPLALGYRLLGRRSLAPILLIGFFNQGVPVRKCAIDRPGCTTAALSIPDRSSSSLIYTHPQSIKNGRRVREKGALTVKNNGKI